MEDQPSFLEEQPKLKKRQLKEIKELKQERIRDQQQREHQRDQLKRLEQELANHTPGTVATTLFSVFLDQ